MKHTRHAVIAGYILCLSSGCNSVIGSDPPLIDDTPVILLAENSGGDIAGPIDPAVLNPIRPVGASARPPRPMGDGDSSNDTDPMLDTAMVASDAPALSGGPGARDTLLTTSIINAWTFPFFEAALMANELSLFADSMTVDLLSPALPSMSSTGFTYLERLCIASGELEFLCRQRYGQ